MNTYPLLYEKGLHKGKTDCRYCIRGNAYGRGEIEAFFNGRYIHSGKSFGVVLAKCKQHREGNDK